MRKVKKLLLVFTLVLVGLICLLSFEIFAMDNNPIVFGTSISQTGAYARSARGQLRSFTLAVEQINEQGGLLGRPVKLVIYDDESNETAAVKLYRKLIYSDKVDFLFSPFGSGPTAAVVPIVEQAKIPCIAPQAVDPRIWEVDRDWSVQVLANAVTYFPPGIDVAVNKFGIKSIAFIYLDSAMQVACVKGAIDYIKEKYPEVKVVLDERFPSGLSDYTPLLAKVKVLKADALFGGGYLQQSMEIAKAAKSVDYYPKVMNLVFAPDPLFGENLKGTAEGVMTPSGWEIGTQTLGNDKFTKDYMERWDGEEPYYDMAACYAAVQLFAEAIRETGTTDKEAIRDYLFTVETITIYGKYKVNEYGAQIGKEMLTIQWQNGKKEVIMPENLATAEPINLWPEK